MQNAIKAISIAIMATLIALIGSSGPAFSADSKIRFTDCEGFGCKEPFELNYSTDGKSVYGTAALRVGESDPNWASMAIYKYDLSSKAATTVVPRHECTKTSAQMSIGDSRTCYVIFNPTLSPDSKKIFFGLRHYSQTMTGTDIGGNPIVSTNIKKETMSLFEFDTNVETDLSKKYQLDTVSIPWEPVAWTGKSDGIYVQSWSSIGNGGAYFLALKSSTPVKTLEPNFYYAISRNGKYAVVKNGAKNTISIKDLKTGKTQIIRKAEFGPIYTPLNDGKNVIALQRFGELSVINVSGKKTIISNSAGFWMSLSPDQKSVIFPKANGPDSVELGAYISQFKLPR